MKLFAAFLLMVFIMNFKPIQRNDLSLTVVVKGVKQEKGKLQACLNKNKEEFLKKASYCTSLDTKTNTVTFVFNNLQRGTYAVSVYQDENDNGKLDTGMFGKPKELYGFSNNPAPKFRAPHFEEASFALNQSQKTIVIDLQ